MKTSKEGLRLITQREGKIMHVYRDSKGLPTAGVGHLILASEHAKYPVGKAITQAENDAWLAQDLGECEDTINGLGVKLKQNEFDALVSLAFNIGVHGFANSTVAKRLKVGNHPAAAEAILLWAKPPEIKGRRRGEYHQFLTPYKDSGTAAPAIIPPADTSANTLSDEQPITATTPSVPDIVGSVNVDIPAANDDQQAVETSVNVTSSQTPAPTDVSIKAESSSWKTTIGAVLTALYGYYKLAKEDFGNLLDTATGALDAHMVANLAIGATLIALAYILYNKSQQRANDRNLALIKAAADPSLNTVSLAK